MNQQLDDSTPTEERQAELTAAYELNPHGPGTFRERVFAIRRGENCCGYFTIRDGQARSTTTPPVYACAALNVLSYLC